MTRYRVIAALHEILPTATGRADNIHSVLGARAGSSSVMIGRHLLLNRLVGLVEAADVTVAGGPGIALVSGEAGVGKTRLLRELGYGPARRGHGAQRASATGLDGPLIRHDWSTWGLGRALWRRGR